MDKIRIHPYLSSIAGALILLALGVFLVMRNSAVSPKTPTLGVWGIDGAAPLNPTAYSPQNPAPANGAGLSVTYAEDLPIPAIPKPDAPTTPSAPSAESFDFDAFFADLVAKRGSGAVNTGQPSAGTSGSIAYTFIPSGLISTTTPTKPRSAAQQALYEYGNEVGSYIQTFEGIGRGSPQILKNQAEDRQNKAKGEAVKDVGRALSAVGTGIEGIEEPPSQAASIHAALIKSYRDAGAKLSLIPEAQRDEDFIAAINEYNASVLILSKNLVALATLFSAAEVRFAQEDPGSVFMFTNSGGF